MGILNRKGIYWIDYYCRDERGNLRRRRESIGTNYKLAKEVLAKRQNEIAESAFFPERHAVRMKFGEASKAFLAWAQVNVGPESFKRYRSSMRKLNESFGNLFLDQMTPALIEKFKAERLVTRTNATVNRDLQVLKELFNHILKGVLLPDVKIPENLPAWIRKLKENNFRTRFASEEEYDALLLGWSQLQLKWNAGIRRRAVPMRELIIAAVHTGMREREIFKVKWPDIDLKNRIIHVREGKGNLYRAVNMNTIVFELIKNLPRRIDTQYLFAHRENGPMCGKPFDWIKMAWNALMEQTGIEDLHFHDLRRTCGSWLAIRGVDLRVIQQVLGHKSILTTLRYTHLAPDQVKRAVEKLTRTRNGRPLHGDFLETSKSGAPEGNRKRAVGDGVSTLGSAGGRTRTGNLRLMKPPL